MPAVANPKPRLRGPKAYLQRRRARRLPLWAGTLLCTAGIFLLLPFTQMIAALGKKPTDLFAVEVAVQPPPPPPPDFGPPEPPPQEPPPPDVQPPPQPLSLSQMDVALNLGVGDAMAGAFSFDGFGVSADDTAGDLQIFDVKDLDRAPRPTRTPVLAYPPDLRRARVKGHVTLLLVIHENGSVTVEKVVNSSLREFEASAIRFAEGTVFEPPTKDGRAVRARYTWPIRFEL
jgi:periplasmic protein TonB